MSEGTTPLLVNRLDAMDQDSPAITIGGLSFLTRKKPVCQAGYLLCQSNLHIPVHPFALLQHACRPVEQVPRDAPIFEIDWPRL
jgi:hypothetical protein